MHHELIVNEELRKYDQDAQDQVWVNLQSVNYEIFIVL